MGGRWVECAGGPLEIAADLHIIGHKIAVGNGPNSSSRTAGEDHIGGVGKRVAAGGYDGVLGM
jgi:hypothetical protein